MGFQMALDLHKALIHSGREQKAKIGGEKKSQDPTTITMLLLFLEGEKTSQQRQQQVQKRKRGSGVCGAKGITSWGLGGCFLFIIVVPTRHVLHSRSKREEEREGGGESEGHNRNDKRLLWSSVVAQTMFARKRQEATKQIELKLRWGWWVGR